LPEILHPSEIVMVKKLAWISALVLTGLILLVGILGTVAAMMVPQSAGGTLASGRSVMTTSTSLSLSSSFSRDTATIETGGHTIVVAPNTLTVDGRKLATIDPAIKSIDVLVEGDAVRFLSNGKVLANCPR
jgi:hypothetical protein